MNKKQILKAIQDELLTAGFPHRTNDYVIGFGFTNNQNSALSIPIRLEVLDKNTFEVLCVMPNTGHKTMDELSSYIFTHKTQYFNIGLSEDLEEIWLVKFMTPDDIDDIRWLIADTLLEIFPYITNK